MLVVHSCIVLWVFAHFKVIMDCESDVFHFGSIQSCLSEISAVVQSYAIVEFRLFQILVLLQNVIYEMCHNLIFYIKAVVYATFISNILQFTHMTLHYVISLPEDKIPAMTLEIFLNSSHGLEQICYTNKISC